MSDPDRREHCGNCGYDLHGLRMEGTCPECGQFYDKFTRKGLGSRLTERQQKADRLLARLRTILLLALAGFVLLIGFVLTLVVTDWRKPVLISAVVASVFALAGLSSFLHERDP